MQELGLMAFLILGVVVCTLVGRAIVLRWRLPWREALMYFGLAPYPGEEPPRHQVRR